MIYGQEEGLGEETYGTQLLERGEVIQFMDKGELLKCRVLSCLAVEGGGCYAALEVLEGDRKGERIETKLRTGPPPRTLLKPELHARAIGIRPRSIR